MSLTYVMLKLTIFNSFDERWKEYDFVNIISVTNKLEVGKLIDWTIHPYLHDLTQMFMNQ